MCYDLKAKKGGFPSIWRAVFRPRVGLPIWVASPRGNPKGPPRRSVSWYTAMGLGGGQKVSSGDAAGTGKRSHGGPPRHSRTRRPHPQTQGLPDAVCHGENVARHAEQEYAQPGPYATPPWDWLSGG